MQPFLCDMGKKLTKWLQALRNKNQIFSFKNSLIFYGHRLFGIRGKNPEKLRKPGAVTKKSFQPVIKNEKKM
ncbi:MAG: hypothetical protein VR68_08730 [Peptococcaceae bacterium BRH_c4a]|nr:MAG: hypothetical protein VR68_08730 [Peptococcaceae bacterium BRH_c4a]